MGRYPLPSLAPALTSVMPDRPETANALARAARDEAAGDFALARHRLKNYLHDRSDDLVARRALAALYRIDGYPDEAGRWGYLLPDGATERERQAFERSCAHRMPPLWRYTSVRRGLRWHQPVEEAPEEVREVLLRLDLAAARERAEWDRMTTPLTVRLRRWLLRR